MLLFVSFAVGWAVASFSEAAARIAGTIGVLLVLLVGLVTAGSGLADPGNLMVAEIHRWTAHLLVICAWWVAPYCGGVVLRRHTWLGALIGRWVLLALAAMATVSASMTGYLLLGARLENDQETFARGVMLHQFVLPIVLLTLVSFWLWIIWPMRRMHPSDSQEPTFQPIEHRGAR
jgi:hypothetical protein